MENVKLYKWVKIDDVPRLVISWANVVADDNVTIDDINELVKSYEDWLDAYTPSNYT